MNRALLANRRRGVAREMNRALGAAAAAAGRSGRASRGAAAPGVVRTAR